MIKHHECIQILRDQSTNWINTRNEQEIKSFLKPSSQYLYFIVWSKDRDIYSWGTTSGRSNRLRKSSLLNSKLTGKYDRRLDYLMLKKTIGLDEIFIFDTIDDPRILESVIKKKNGTKYCYKGIRGNNRDEISRSIYNEFKKTKHYLNSSEKDKSRFDEYFEEVFLGRMRHPANPKRTFFFGDSLEPKFLRTIGKSYLEESIENLLDVKFYN